MSRATPRALAVTVCVFAVVTAPVLAVSTTPQAAAPSSAIRTVESNTTHPFVAVNSPARSQGVVRQAAALPNTITIRSTGDERVYYTIRVSGRIEPLSGADLDEADVPDSVSGATATGSTAEGGSDNFTFSGRITTLVLSGGPARVYINGELIDLSEFPIAPPRTPTPILTPTATPTPTVTPTPTPAATPTATPTATQTPTPTAQTPTPQPTEVPPATTTTNATQVATDTPVNGSASPTGESGILSGVSGSTLLYLFGFLVLLVFVAAAVVARYNRSRPETALDSKWK